MTTISEARDLMFGLIRTAWLANPTSASIPILWDNTEGTKPGNDSFGVPLPWIRVSSRHTLGEQDTFGAIGARRYMNGGVLQVQVFTALGKGHALSDSLIEILKAALRAAPTSHAVWFFDIAVSEMGPDGPWFNVNLDASFRYQERA